MNRKSRKPEPVGVAYILPGLGLGGTEKHVLDLSSRIDRRRFLPCVLSTATDETMAGDFAEHDVPVFQLPYRGLSLRRGLALPLLRDARTFFGKFGRILSERRVAIIHAYLPAANVLAMAATLGRGRTIRIVSKRALCCYKDGHPVYSFFEDLANLAADAVLVNSRAVAADVQRKERFVEGKMFLVHNGLEPSAAREAGRHPLRRDIGLPAGGTVAVCVSNFFEYKGHAELVEAGARLAADFPHLTWLLIGKDAGALEATRDLARERGVLDRFRFAGARPDVPDLLRAADLFVHPSRQEGFSTAILEAMAAGLPVVACDVGGNPEAVVDGETGRLVPPRAPERLADAVRELLLDAGKRASMGAAGMRRVRERFSMERMVSAVEETYTELLEGRPLSRRL